MTTALSALARSNLSFRSHIQRLGRSCCGGRKRARDLRSHEMGADVCELQPRPFVWVRSADGKATLAGLAAEQNKPKILQAPVTVIIGHDLDFAGQLPKLLPHNAEVMQKYFAGPGVADVTAMRNGTLQGAYLIVAARALGLDCGPMSGFDNAGVDTAFFSGTRIQSNFICSIGYGDPASVFPRNPRLDFEEAGRWA